jgi:hypothetical protein
VADRRREQRTINTAKLRRRDVAAQNLKLVAQDQQLDVLHVRRRNRSSAPSKALNAR